MKKLIIIVLLLYVAIIAGRIAHDVLVAQGAPPPTENGDVNGDGTRDISDGIYLLSWLFSGGPEPVALAGSGIESRVAELEAAVAALQASGGGTAAALESLALLLGDGSIAEAVPASALQPLDRMTPLVLTVDGNPFGEVIGAHIIEEVSACPVAHVVARIEASVLETGPLLGLPARLDFQQEDRLTHFAGEVVAAGYAGRQGRGGIIRLSIAPRLERLARGRKSKTFEDVKYTDIVNQLLNDHAVPHEFSLSQTLHREFVVQYQETDFDFVNRLLEEEGIHYFFEHGPEGETLRIFGNSLSAPEIPGVFAYRGHQAGAPSPGHAYIHTLHAASRPVPGTVQVSGWDYVAKQRITRAQTTGSGGALQEFFLGERDGVEEVDLDARTRRDRARIDSSLVLGTSTVSTLRPGKAVTIGGVGGSFDGKYFVTSVRHTIVKTPGGGESGFLYANAFTCIPAAVPFVPERRTPGPTIEGTQTAIVTDNQDPDRLGRVKVKFPWLPSGDTGSAWVRLATFGAGKDRGTYWLPEVDDEVLVAFTHGEPNHPIIVGSLWNGKDRPPQEAGDGGKNDIRFFKSRSGHTLLFDDTEGKERISIRAVKPLDESSTIGLEADSTQVTGVLASSSNAGPERPVQPGERHRDNAIVAWARISAAGAVVGQASFGVEQVRRVRPGTYAVSIGASASSAAELIPVAVADVSGAPATQGEMRVASVEQVDAESFVVYVNNGLGQPVDAGFVIVVTAR